MPASARPAASRILSAQAVRIIPERAAVGTSPAAAPEGTCTAAPQVETRLRQGVVSQIIVTCSCGQRTVIDCDYSEVASAR